MKPILYSIIFAILISSCASFTNPNSYIAESIENVDELQQLNGKFAVFQEDCNERNLASMLHFDTEVICIEEQKDRYFIELSVIDKKEVLAKLFKGDFLLEEKNLKGRIKDNYFRKRTDFYFNIAYVILNIYTEDDTRIGILQNKNLSVDTTGGTCGLFIVFPIFCAGGDSNNNEFERLHE